MAKKKSPEVRKKQILDAAKKLFVQKGYHGTSIDDITRECGLTKGGIYWHFKSKWDIYIAMIEDHKEAMQTLWRSIREIPLEQEQLIQGGLMFIRDHLKDEWISGVFHEIEAESVRNEEIRVQYLSIIKSEKKNLELLVAEAGSRGVIKNIDTGLLSEIIFLFMSSCIHFYSLSKGAFDIEKTWRVFCELMLTGVLNK